MPITLGELRLEHFASFVGQTFRFRRPDVQPGENPEVDLTLVDAAERPRLNDLGDRDPFALLFELPAGGGRPLSVYAHVLTGGGGGLLTELEQCPLLLSRVFDPKRMREKPNGQFYEVIFG